MPHPHQALAYSFYLRFIEWFENSGVDFWNEYNAPEELARIAAEVTTENKSLIQE